MILDDAIMDKRDIPFFIRVWVRIFPCDLAVRSPAGMRNPDRTCHLPQLEPGIHFVNLSDILSSMNLLPIKACYADRIITTIFQLPDCLKQDGACLPISYVSDYAAHFSGRRK